MSGSTVDQKLLAIASGAAPATIADVITTMEKIDALLPGNDGLKWFNLLYLMVTKEVLKRTPGEGWRDPGWIAKLDVVFASMYFAAIGRFLGGGASSSKSWTVLFEARNTAGIDRIQFALAGMNAHINHDLPRALLDTDKQLRVTPGRTSPEHDDYENVNDLLERVIPSALQFLATGPLGELAQDTGKIGQLLAFWNVRAARDLAWDFSDSLRNLPTAVQEFTSAAHDQLVAALGRSLLIRV